MASHFDLREVESWSTNFRKCESRCWTIRSDGDQPEETQLTLNEGEVVAQWTVASNHLKTHGAHDVFSLVLLPLLEV